MTLPGARFAPCTRSYRSSFSTVGFKGNMLLEDLNAFNIAWSVEIVWALGGGRTQAGDPSCTFPALQDDLGALP
jgi:hypothetical protein